MPRQRRTTTTLLGTGQTINTADAPYRALVGSGAPQGRKTMSETHTAAAQSVAMLYVELPYPPTTNNLYATVNGRRVKSKAARAYAKACALAVQDAVDPTEPLPLPPFSLVVHLWAPDRRKRDIDGCLKAPIDNLFAALRTPEYWVDDSMIEELHVHKGIDRERPRMTLILGQRRLKGV